MHEQSSPRSWRPWLRLSLRGLMLLILFSAVWLGWIVHRSHVQHDAVAAIQNAGGVAMYDWEWQNNMPVSNGKPWAPKWLVDRLGVDYFGHIVFVQVYPDHGRADAEQVLSRIGHLGRLEILNLFGPSVTDTRLNCVSGLANLKEMKLNGTQVGGSGLKHLKGLSRLRVLRFEDTPVGDAGLKHLTDLNDLKELWCYRTRITDSGAAKLQKALPRLMIIR
jgi:hypothetical protein